MLSAKPVTGVTAASHFTDWLTFGTLDLLLLVDLLLLSANSPEFELDLAGNRGAVTVSCSHASCTGSAIRTSREARLVRPADQ